MSERQPDTPLITTAQRRFAGHTLPEGWRRVQLGELFSEIVDTGHRGARHVLAVTIDRGVVRRESLDRKKGREVSREQYRLARRGDLVYNTMRMWQGASGLALEEGYVSPAYTVARPKDGEVPEFWAHYFKEPATISRFREHSQGFAKDRYRLYFRHFATVPALRPPPPEQRKIADILSSVDAAIEKTQLVISQSDVVKRSLMQVLLRRGLPGRHAKFKKTDIGEIPAAWGVSRVGDAGEWLSGGTPRKSRQEFWSGTIPWVSPKDMKTARIANAIDHVSKEGASNGSRLLASGAILLVARGMILAHSVPVALTTREVAFNQDIKALMPRQEFDPEYLLYSFQHEEPRLLKLIDTATHGTKRLPTPKLFNLPLPQPPRAEQEAIAAILRSLDHRVEASRRSLQAHETLRRALSSVLLSGAVRVQPDREAE